MVTSQGEFHIIETKNARFAIVIKDQKKAEQFTKNFKTFKNKYLNKWSKMNQESAVAELINNNDSGMEFYKATDKNKTDFKKVD